MIKNIIFDFGGVIYDIDHQKTRKAFEGLGLPDFEKLYGHVVQTRLFEDLEVGAISADNFRSAIRVYLPKNITNVQIDKAWNELLLGFNLDRFTLLNKVKNNYRLFLLSNTNEIHYHQYINELRSINQLDEFTGFFEKLYFSHQIKMRKPNAEIFQFVLSENSLDPKETAFIDDFKLNITAAEMQGIHGIFLEPGNDITSLFNSEGKLNSL